MEPADVVEEMLTADPLDFATTELEELDEVANTPETSQAAAALPNGRPLASMPTRVIKENLQKWAEMRDFITLANPAKKDELEHLIQRIERISLDAAREELKRREKQTTLDRYASFSRPCFVSLGVFFHRHRKKKP